MPKQIKTQINQIKIAPKYGVPKPPSNPPPEYLENPDFQKQFLKQKLITKNTN